MADNTSGDSVTVFDELEPVTGGLTDEDDARVDVGARRGKSADPKLFRVLRAINKLKTTATSKIPERLTTATSKQATRNGKTLAFAKHEDRKIRRDGLTRVALHNNGPPHIRVGNR